MWMNVARHLRLFAGLFMDTLTRIHRRRTDTDRSIKMGHRTEALELRAMLSADTGLLDPRDLPDFQTNDETQQITVVDGAGDHTTKEIPLGRGMPQSSRRRVKLNLTGQYSVPTALGTVELTVTQKRKKIAGEADAGNLNLSQVLNLSLPIPIPLTVPPISFKGTFKKGMLNLDYQTTVRLPVLGTPLFLIAGTIQGRIDLSQGFVGRLTAGVNGNQLYETNFILPLSSLPRFPARIA